MFTQLLTYVKWMTFLLKSLIIIDCEGLVGIWVYYISCFVGLVCILRFFLPFKLHDFGYSIFSFVFCCCNADEDRD